MEARDVILLTISFVGAAYCGMLIHSGIHDLDIAYNLLSMENQMLKEGIEASLSDTGTDLSVKYASQIHLEGMQKIYIGSIVIVLASLVFGHVIRR